MSATIEGPPPSKVPSWWKKKQQKQCILNAQNPQHSHPATHQFLLASLVQHTLHVQPVSTVGKPIGGILSTPSGGELCGARAVVGATVMTGVCVAIGIRWPSWWRGVPRRGLCVGRARVAVRWGVCGYLGWCRRVVVRPGCLQEVVVQVVYEWTEDGIRKGMIAAKCACHVLWRHGGVVVVRAMRAHLWMVTLVYANGILQPIANIYGGEEQYGRVCHCLRNGRQAVRKHPMLGSMYYSSSIEWPAAQHVH